MDPAPSPKLLVVNQYYAPDLSSTGLLAAEICSNLAQRGIEVHVVTGQPSYTGSAKGAPSFEVLDGVSVHRVSLGGARGRERVMTRMLGYVRFMIRGYRAAKDVVRSQRFDAILTFHNPPFLGMIGAHLANRYKLRYVYCPQDILPDILVATGWGRLPRPAICIWNAINRWVFRRASVVIVLGEGMKRTLVEGKGVPDDKVRVIPVWARPEMEPRPGTQDIRSELGIGEDELLLLYSGNMGIMHPLDPFLDAAAALGGLPVRFVFVGEGPQRARSVARAQEEKLDRVVFLPFQPEDRFVKLVAASDACLVSLGFGMERLCVPSRAYTFISAGRPLITVMSPEGDVASMVNAAGCGWNVTTPGELIALVRWLFANRDELTRRGRRARQVYQGRYSRQLIMQAYADAVTGDAMA